MTVRLSELAELVGGAIGGDGQLLITGAAILTTAGPGEITFVDRPQLLDQVARSTATAVVVPNDLRPEGKAFIAVENARQAFAQIVSKFQPSRPVKKVGISPVAVVSPTAKLADDVEIRPGAVIEDDVTIGRGTVIHAGVCVMAGCQIGERVTIYPRAVLYENTVVGNDVIIHAGAVLGANGFGYEFQADRHVLSPQLGNVELGDHVEVGANTTIDRGTYGPTRIGEGTKIDNLVMIGHNCQIGRHNLLCGQVGIAGSCVTGDYVVMAGQVGVRDHVEIGNRVMIGAQSGVTEAIREPGKYLGSPAIPARKGMQLVFALQRLPELIKDLARERNS
jgi:UDP-3-O-[3-hydroxymyristoyl] glucosamine N-acyltransferase